MEAGSKKKKKNQDVAREIFSPNSLGVDSSLASLTLVIPGISYFVAM